MTDDFPSIVTRLIEADEQRGRPVARSQWAPADCRCPWPWPLNDGHIRLDCPHYVAAPPAGRSVVTNSSKETP